MKFTYDGKAFGSGSKSKGDHHVVAVPQATSVAAFTDSQSADEDAADRNQRATDLDIQTRYKVCNVSDGTPVRD